jgi:flagellar biosynthetic protein FlhB
MSGSEGGGERTEAATPRRLMRAREEGRVPLSREAAPVAVLAMGALLLVVAGPAAARGLLQRLAALLAASAATPPEVALHRALLAAMLLAGPFLLACAAAGTIAVLAQTGLALNLNALLPDLARLDPRRGLGRLISPTALLEAGKSLLKLVAVAGVAWMVLGGALPLLPAAMLWDPVTLLDHTARQVLRVTLALLGAQAVIAGFDIARSRFSFARGLRMTREEVKEEHKDTEGDPRIKGRIRRLRMQRARRRMMQAVPKAAVVVTNPTHYAVALAYQRGSVSAPRVIAKGVDTLAWRIRDVAREHNVPIVANPPLARTLYALELDAEIPRELYQTVAEVIAYVWKLRTRRR